MYVDVTTYDLSKSSRLSLSNQSNGQNTTKQEDIEAESASASTSGLDCHVAAHAKISNSTNHVT